MWLPSDADGLRGFLVECGWATDGAHREMGVDEDSPSVKLVRMVTDITAGES